MMRHYADLLGSVGEFIDSQGRKAKRWVRCGVVMKDAGTGKMSIKLDAIPVSPNWSGWLAVRNVEKEDPAGDQGNAGAEENQDLEVAE
jgi:hypothetical protein